MLLYPEMNVYEFEIKPSYSQDEKCEMYEYFKNKHLFYKKHDPQYKNIYYNFLIDKYNYFFDKIYDDFLEISCNIFGKITLSKKNSRKCWINVSSRNDITAKHNHILSSTINSVFYFNIPDNKSGQIIFSNNDKVIKHQPLENSLIVFPNYLDHEPLMCNSDEYRMAVNMEIITEENVWSKFNGV